MWLISHLVTIQDHRYERNHLPVCMLIKPLPTEDRPLPHKTIKEVYWRRLRLGFGFGHQPCWKPKYMHCFLCFLWLILQFCSYKIQGCKDLCVYEVVSAEYGDNFDSFLQPQPEPNRWLDRKPRKCWCYSSCCPWISSWTYEPAHQAQDFCWHRRWLQMATPPSSLCVAADCWYWVFVHSCCAYGRLI